VLTVRDDGTQAREALAKLCQTYWYPLYAYVRRKGHSPHDAQDLTQAFFEDFLEHRSFASVTPGRGKFRSYLLISMKNFLAGRWRHSNAQKRGGGIQILSLDWVAAEKRFDLEPATGASPDKLYEKQWALTILCDVLSQLEQQYGREGKAALFRALKLTLLGARESQPYVRLALGLGMSESAVKVAVHRLRRRYRQLIRTQIANTLQDSRELENEMRHLFQVLAGGQ
jgi:RNA polymerase sigma-70 factor (ECF subfamily)